MKTDPIFEQLVSLVKLLDYSDLSRLHEVIADLLSEYKTEQDGPTYGLFYDSTISYLHAIYSVDRLKMLKKWSTLSKVNRKTFIRAANELFDYFEGTLGLKYTTKFELWQCILGFMISSPILKEHMLSFDLIIYSLKDAPRQFDNAFPGYKNSPAWLALLKRILVKP